MSRALETESLNPDAGASVASKSHHLSRAREILADHHREFQRMQVYRLCHGTCYKLLTSRLTSSNLATAPTSYHPFNRTLIDTKLLKVEATVRNHTCYQKGRASKSPMAWRTRYWRKHMRHEKSLQDREIHWRNWIDDWLLQQVSITNQQDKYSLG